MVHLFLYSLAYALVRLLLRNRKISTGKAPNILLILGLGALIAVLSLVVRIYYPVDKWVDVLGVTGVEPAHLPQYALLFAFGVVAYRKGYFTSLSKRTGFLALALGLAMAAVIYLSRLPVLARIMPFIWDIWPIYESFMCVFLCFGLLVFFRTYCSRTNFILRKLGHLIIRSFDGWHAVHRQSAFAVDLHHLQPNHLNGVRGLKPFGTHLRAIHDGAATEQSISVVQVI